MAQNNPRSYRTRARDGVIAAVAQEIIKEYPATNIKRALEIAEYRVTRTGGSIMPCGKKKGKRKKKGGK